MACAGEKVVVAMSGGVDSSVAALALSRAGYEVTGLFLRLGGPRCDPTDARRVAETLGIELVVIDAAEALAPIIDYFADEYARGRTPNPCVRCNAEIKLPALLARADELGARFVATGHHARMVVHESAAAIARAGEKDQSYALFAVARERLGRILFPIGEIGGRAGKAEVRRIAAEAGLPVADKPDSQEICFIEGDYVELLRARRPEALRPGKIVNSAGEVLGAHDGYAGFTIGQRRGLGVAAGRPMYVMGIDPATATVTIGAAEEAMSSRLVAAGANWHCDVPAEFDAVVRVRYGHAGAPGRVRITGETDFEVQFRQPVHAVTPGQAAVVYQNDRLLGGGWIEPGSD